MCLGICWRWTFVITIVCVLRIEHVPAAAAEVAELASALVFHAPFDGSCDAALSRGDGRIYTAEDLSRKNIRPGVQRQGAALAEGAGRYGDALRFACSSKQVLMYKAESVAFRETDWSGTVSFWLKLDPNKDLEPGFCDPLQMTDKKWNDAAMFVDFDKDLPRDFRLGVFSDYRRWNPDDVAWEEFPLEKRPLVTVKNPPFSKTTWTHVLFTFQHVNADDNGRSAASLYLNGELQGTLRQPLEFHWDVPKAAVMLGIQYIGDFDDLAIFDRALTADEIQLLRQLPRGVSDIRAVRDEGASR